VLTEDIAVRARELRLDLDADKKVCRDPTRSRDPSPGRAL